MKRLYSRKDLDLHQERLNHYLKRKTSCFGQKVFYRKTLATNVTRHHHFHEWCVLCTQKWKGAWANPCQIAYTRGLESVLSSNMENMSQKIILVVLRDEKQSRKLFSTMQTLPPQIDVLLHFLSSTELKSLSTRSTQQCFLLETSVTSDIFMLVLQAGSWPQ